MRKIIKKSTLKTTPSIKDKTILLLEKKIKKLETRIEYFESILNNGIETKVIHLNTEKNLKAFKEK